MTEKQELFLEALFGEAEGDIRKAMRMAGYSDGTRPSSVTSAVAEEIETRTRNMFATTSPKSLFVLKQILEGSNPDAFLGAKEKIAVAKDILDRAGFGKTDKVEVKAASPLFILPPKDSDED